MVSIISSLDNVRVSVRGCMNNGIAIEFYDQIKVINSGLNFIRTESICDILKKCLLDNDFFSINFTNIAQYFALDGNLNKLRLSYENNIFSCNFNCIDKDLYNKWFNELIKILLNKEVFSVVVAFTDDYNYLIYTNKNNKINGYQNLIFEDVDNKEKTIFNESEFDYFKDWIRRKLGIGYEYYDTFHYDLISKNNLIKNKNKGRKFDL